MRAGVDWLEAGTPFILAEGLHGAQKVARNISGHTNRRRPQDYGRRLPGGRNDGESETHSCGCYGRAHEETIKCVVKDGKDYGIKVMGDNLGCPDMVDAAKMLEDLGCDVIHHIGYDERRGIAARGQRMPGPRPVARSSAGC